jgi:hypothetical protein
VYEKQNPKNTIRNRITLREDNSTAKSKNPATASFSFAGSPEGKT